MIQITNDKQVRDLRRHWFPGSLDLPLHKNKPQRNSRLQSRLSQLEFHVTFHWRAWHRIKTHSADRHLARLSLVINPSAAALLNCRLSTWWFILCITETEVCAVTQLIVLQKHPCSRPKSGLIINRLINVLLRWQGKCITTDIGKLLFYLFNVDGMSLRCRDVLSVGIFPLFSVPAHPVMFYSFFHMK